MNTKATDLLYKLFDLYEEATSPSPEEVRTDMLNQILAMIPTMEPGMNAEFSDFVQWIGAQRLGLSGTVEEILGKLHPWMLQLVLQRFKLPAPSPSGTPLVGVNR